MIISQFSILRFYLLAFHIIIKKLYFLPIHIHFSFSSYSPNIILSQVCVSEKSRFAFLKLCQNSSLMSRRVIYDASFFIVKIIVAILALFLFIVFVFYLVIAIFF